MSEKYLTKFTALFLLLAFAGFLSVETFGQKKEDRKRAEKLMSEGKKAYDRRNFQAAVKNYGDALVILPDNADARYYKGASHFYLSQYDLAVSELDRAQTNYQKPMEIYRIRWQANDKLQRYDQALADVTKVLAAEPSNPTLLVAAAEINYSKGNYADAAPAFEKLIATSPRAPNLADLYYKLAVSRSKLGNIEGAAAAADEAIKRNTLNLADAQMILAKARFSQKRIPEAIEAYTKALQSRPDKVEAYRQLAELYRTEDRVPEGIEILKKGKKEYPNNGEIFTDLSLFYSLAEMPEEAVEAGKAAAQLLPDKAAGHTHLCRAYAGVNKPDLAVSSCNTALRLVPDDGETLFYLGRALDGKNKKEAAKNYTKAVESLTALTKASPESADAFYLLGNAYSELQDNINAVPAYKRTIELNPKYSRAFFNLAVIYINERKKAEALTQYNALLVLNEKLAASLKPDIDKLPAN